MELLYIVGFFGGIFFIGWLFSKISEWFEKHREKIRDQVADEVFAGTNPDKIIDQYKEKIGRIKLVLKSDRDAKNIENYVYSQFPKYYRLLGKCPKCNNGSLVRRRGEYGIFIGCSLYPKCDYKISVKNLKKDFGEKMQKAFLGEFKRAYDL